METLDELSHWATIHKSECPGVFRDFMVRFPEGAKVRLAAERLGFLEERAWDEGSAARDEQSIRKFLVDFPNGAYHREAQRRLQEVTLRNEKTAWVQITPDNAQDLRAFILKFPNGIHASEGRRRLRNQRLAAFWKRRPRLYFKHIVYAAAGVAVLSTATCYWRDQAAIERARLADESADRLAAEQAPADFAAWKKADAEGLMDSWQSYLIEYPAGRYAARARSSIAKRKANRLIRRYGEGGDAVAFSPDGSQLLSAGSSRDRTPRIWSTKSGEQLRQLNGHSWSVQAVAVSPDGRLAITGSGNPWLTLESESKKDRDYSLRLWLVASGRAIHYFGNHRESINSVAFSPDGQIALSADDSKKVRIWDVANGRELRSFDGHSSAVKSVAFHPNGRWAISAANPNELKMWDVSNAKQIRDFEGGSTYLESVAISRDGSLVVSGGHDGIVRIWDALTGKQLRTLVGHTSIVNSLASPQMVAASCRAEWMGL